MSKPASRPEDTDTKLSRLIAEAEARLKVVCAELIEMIGPVSMSAMLIDGWGRRRTS